MSLLQARGVAHTFPGPVRALEGVDLELAPGEVLAVIGPNGSGKSTLLRCLAGLLRPSAGAILLAGRPMALHSHRERARQLAVVPQFLPELPDVQVEHFVLGGRYAHLQRFRGAGRADLDAVDAALEAADVGQWRTRLMNELSGGQRQRVLIARALAQQAAALLIDEPTNALDPEHQLRVFELIARLTCDGRAAMVVTHDLNLASQFATRLVLLDQGRVVAGGAVAEVLRREVLEPVYGPNLHYGTLRARDGREHAFVLPWLERGR